MQSKTQAPSKALPFATPGTPCLGSSATFVRAGVLMFLVATAGGCGSDDTPATNPQMEVAGAMPGSNAMPGSGTPATPATEAPPASDTPAPSNEGNMGAVPLQPTPAAGGGATPAPAQPPAMQPPMTQPPMTQPPAQEPPAQEPPDPPAFAPCPTDGTACRILPLGDSITFGIGSSGGGYRVELFEQAVADGHEITFVGRQNNGPANVAGQQFPTSHEGYPGITIQNLGSQQVNPALAAADPDIILLHIGTNNMYQAATAQAAPGALESLLDQLIDGAPDALIVVAQIVPTQSFNQNVQPFNAAIPALVQERVAEGAHLILVDMFGALANGPGGANAQLADVVHPNDAGYALMAETWYEAIESFLP